ncbi:1-deoxy-D-xylulose 5-phosphate reductoisomerase [Polystyrenella longa]|uniref:1-deoxy-D-xylulose 5-phosphate reductoisomerase n=1 Tax=Polystyrenella longa TaxID=2528007 RepID=A0A518CT47_9PLAN|nr:1-deoxy-D-xylulose-5-phosphate reductoisomerase [Polystyrenella longa]QDU82402.1 1-deoxy-D-xylulose 5-phosphate reductoisomerase [Polystyrenella longa]
MTEIALLGSTGSIGTSTLEVLRQHSDRLQLRGIAAHRSWQQLAQQTQEFQPAIAVVGDETLRTEIDRTAFHPETEIRFGQEGIESLAADSEVDTVVSAIVGAAGLGGTWAAVEAGKRVAIANKETLVVAGPIVKALAEKTGAILLPVDSEHSALFQCLQAGRREELKRIILTASGGPFRGWKKDQLREVTPEMALDHPTWNMGPKITIDSATLMNKALEIIEAKWLFDLADSEIEVMIHPQSIVHSFVEFNDNSVLAQLSPPDMKLPIQYALTWPERWEGAAQAMDWTQMFSLEFHPPDHDAFPALQLGLETASRGGTAGAVLNAANEAAVQRFLDGSLRFDQIVLAIQDILKAHHFDPSPDLHELKKWDRWAREEMKKWN